MAFAVLAEPSRREILDLLRERERSVGELVDHLRLSQPGVSKHLRVLREAGLVDVRVDAQRRVYRVQPLPCRRSTPGSRRTAPPGLIASTLSNATSTRCLTKERPDMPD